MLEKGQVGLYYGTTLIRSVIAVKEVYASPERDIINIIYSADNQQIAISVSLLTSIEHDGITQRWTAIAPVSPSTAAIDKFNLVYDYCANYIWKGCCCDSSPATVGGGGALVYNTGVTTSGDTVSDTVTPTYFSSHYVIPEGPSQNTLIVQHASGQYIPSFTPPHSIIFKWKLIGAISGTNYLLGEVTGITLSDTPQYYNWSFKGDLIFNSIPGITSNVVASGTLTIEDWVIEHKDWPIGTDVGGLSVDNTEPLQLVLEIEWNIADADNRFIQFQTSVWQQTVAPITVYDAGNAFIVEITRATLQSLIALGAVSPKTIYRIIDAIGATEVIDVMGLSATTISDPAVNFTTNEYGNYDITTDVFVPVAGGGGSGVWGAITGTITAQTDLVDAIQNSEWIYGETTGTNTYVDSLVPALTAYQTGQVFWMKFTNGNTGASTLNLNGLGAIALVKNVSTALASGDIPAGIILPVMYDGTNFQVDLRFAGNPTWQQVLIAGSTLTQNNTINGGGFQLSFNNLFRFIISTSGYFRSICDNGVDSSSVSHGPNQLRVDNCVLDTSLSTSVASAATTDLGVASVTGNVIHITGTTTITSFDTASDGAIRELIFDASLTLTHNATSLILPTGANIITEAGDTATFVNEGGSNWRCLDYQRASGEALSASVTVRSLVKENTTIAHTGTTTETKLWSGLIAGGTFAAEDVFEFSMFQGGNGSGNKTWRLYVNTSDTLAGATLIGTYAYTAANLWGLFNRALVFNDSVSSQKTNNVTTSAQTSGGNNTAAVATLTTDYSIDQYFIVSCQLATIANTCNIWGVFSQLNR